MQQFAAAAAADHAPPRDAPETAGEALAPAPESAWGAVPPAYAAQHALVAAPQRAAAWGAVPPPSAAWGAVPPAYAPQHALVPAPYGFPPVAAPQQNVPPPPYPAVAPDNALTALERALAPKVEPTPAFLELERWVEAHVANVERRRSVLDAAESLEDLKACDAEELEEILDLNTWPRLARQRFLGAWRELKGEEEMEEVEEGALVPFALPTFAVGALVDADFQARGHYFPAVVAAAHGDGTYRVAFDDGSVEERTDRVRASPWRRDGTPWDGRPLLCPWGRIGASNCTCAAALVKWLPADGNTPALYRVECCGVHAGARMDLQAAACESCARAYRPPPPRAPLALAAAPVALDEERAALAARVARAGRDAMDVDGGDVAAPVQDDDDIEAPPPAADEDDDADMTGEVSNDEAPPRQKRARASSESDEASEDEPGDGAASFPVGAWVRHTPLGKNGIVTSVYDDGERYNIKCVDGGTTTWGQSALELAPGTAPAELVDLAASCGTKRGDWVRDTETGAKGVIVKVSSGIRTILCGDDEELKRRPCSFRLADGAAPAALVAKAKAWRKTAKKKAPPPPPRKRAAPADAESSEEEDEESEESVPARPKRARAPKKSSDVSFPVGTWVRDAQSTCEGSAVDGVIVEVRERGWRTVLCADGTTFNKQPNYLRPAPGAPPATLLAKAAKWRAPVRTPKPRPKPPPRAAAPPRAARGDAPPRTQQRPKGAPEGAVFDHAVKWLGQWRSPASSNTKIRPLWCVWRPGIRLLDDDELDTPMRKRGAWEVRWADRTESFVARSDVRVCVPTRERLKAEAQAPAPPASKRARRVTESPQPRPPSPRGAAPAPPVGGLRREARPAPRPRGVSATQRNVSADTRALAEYLRVCGAQDPEKLAAGWSFSYKTRMFGTTAGTGDRYFHPPDGGKQLRSMAEVARWHGLAAATSRGGGGKVLSEEEKRELEERRAMAKEDKRAASRTGHPPEKRDWYAVAGAKKKDYTPVADGLITKIRNQRGQAGGVFARLAVGGVFLQSRFDAPRIAECALKVAAKAQRCVCGRSEGGDYVKCAGGVNGRCHGFVHRRCVGLTAEEVVPDGWLCPLCDTRGVAAKLSVHDGPLANSSPLIGRVLLQASGAAATGEDEDDGAAQAPLLLRAVGARKQRGGDVLVRCVALFGEGDETYEISEATARRAAVRRETAEAQAIVAMHARGGKYTFHTTTEDCNVCSHCLDKQSNGGTGTLKRACIAKDDERAVALLYLASGAPPPGGGQWSTHGAAPPPATTPQRKHVYWDNEKNLDGDPDSDDEEGFVKKDARVVAPWVDGQWYSATIVFVGRRTARVAFEDGTIHTVQRSELLEDDRSSRRSVAKKVVTPAKPRPAPAVPPPPPPPPRPTGPCAICMSTIDDGAHVLQCGHAFHASCLRDMSDVVRIASATRRSRGVACPLCRKVSRAEVGVDADEA